MAAKKRRTALRRGLVSDVKHAFELAIDMTGSFSPDAMDHWRPRLRALRREVLADLKKEV